MYIILFFNYIHEYQNSNYVFI